MVVLTKLTGGIWTDSEKRRVWISAAYATAGHVSSRTSTPSSTSSSTSSSFHCSSGISPSDITSTLAQLSSLEENAEEWGSTLPGQGSSSGPGGHEGSVPLPLNADKELQNDFNRLLSMFAPNNSDDDHLQSRPNKRAHVPLDSSGTSAWIRLQGKGLHQCMLRTLQTTSPSIA